MSELLSIAIPTYKRSRYLSALLLSIDEQYSKDMDEFIHIYIFDNGPSNDTEKILENLDLKFAYSHIRHGRNIGAKNNVHYAYTHARGKYIWVIGDDEVLPSESLKTIVNSINKYSPGLIINRTSKHDIFNRSPAYYKNYEELALNSIRINPHFLIAHSLISSNVIRCDCFDVDISKEKIDSAYSHFFGIINGVIEKEAAVVYPKQNTLIVRKQRARMHFEDGENSNSILVEQNRYLKWLFNKLGNRNFKTNFESIAINLAEKFKKFIAINNLNEELNIIQSILIDNRLRTIQQNKDPEHCKNTELEMEHIMATCDKFDIKSLRIQNKNNNKTLNYKNNGYSIKGLTKIGNGKKFTVAVWGFYEASFRNNRVFSNFDATIGDSLSKSMNDLFHVARQNSIELKSLDTIQDIEEVDAFLFWDLPRIDNNPLVMRAMTSKKPCYLVIAESPIILPDNWAEANQNHFSKIFTYFDDIVDNHKFFKLNYATDIPSTIPRYEGQERHLCTMIAGCRHVEHELSLYPDRVEAIRWFERHHPDEFHLYGTGWNSTEYQSYRGQIESKQDILKNYKFSICYENVRNIKGYITEGIFDCLKAGCVPVYWGAANISDHIPKDCFIDKRDFADYGSLYDYLKGISDETYQEYLGNIEDFFNSEKAFPFTMGAFVKTLLEQIADRPMDVSQLSRKINSQKKLAEPIGPNRANEIPISLFVTVYNEEERIPFIIESGVKWADEIVVINKSSTDRTKEVCRQFGDKVKVVDVPFSPSGIADTIEHCKIPANDWIFLCTASEVPTKRVIEQAKQILHKTQGNLDLIYVPRKYYSFGIHDKRSPWSISYFPFLINRKKTIISNTIHKNFRPSDPRNTAKIEFSEDCCVYHLTHPTAKAYLHGMTDYFQAEAKGCNNPAAKIQECMVNITRFEKQLRNGGNDLLGHYFAWQIYWLGTALFAWEKWRGIDVMRYYKELRKRTFEEEWLQNADEGPVFLSNQAPEPKVPQKKPLVSAIVSTFNSERFIRGCLEDLESQTISEKLEIIVIDSASEQNEESIVKEFQKKYQNIRYLKTEQRETVYAAWNRGIKAASGKFITNANTDDRHLPYAFERMVHMLENTPDVSLVYADVWITENENETHRNFSASGTYCWKDFDPKTLAEGCYIGPQPMWRKDVHEEYGYFDETFHSAGDWEFWLRISKTRKFLHLNEFLGLYLKSPTSVEHRDLELSRAEVKHIRRLYASRSNENVTAVEKMHRNAQILINTGRKKEAKMALLELINVHPDFANAYNDLGVLYLDENDKANALKHYQKAVELAPGNPTFAKNLADFYFIKLDRAEAAMEIYVKLLAEHPTDVEILTAIGHICVRLGEYDNARTFFYRILETDPLNQEAQNILDELAKGNEIETVDKETEESEKETNDSNVDSAEKIYRDTLALIKKEGNDEGIKSLKRLLETYPEFGLAHNDLGVLYFQKGDKERALKHYEYAARIQPQNHTFQKNLADFYFVEAGRVQEALQIYTKLLETNPTDIEILLTMALICEAFMKIDDATGFYAKVLEIEPGNLEIRKKIVELTEGRKLEFPEQITSFRSSEKKRTAAENNTDITNDPDVKESPKNSYNSCQKSYAVS